MFTHSPSFSLTPEKSNRAWQNWILGISLCAFNLGHTALAADDLAQMPLSHAEASSLVKPNLMFILDDSGSMQQQYTPDYVSVYPGFPGDTTDPNNGTTPERHCKDSLDDTNTNNDRCDVGDPPYMSPDFNTQYYNPAITYTPPIDHAGVSYNSQNAANTTNWTAVATDPYGKQQYDIRKKSVTTTNLVTGFPDRVWCNNNNSATFDDKANTSKCRRNTSGYYYPDSTFGYGRLSGASAANSIQYAFGAPYYFKINAGEYCKDAQLKDCIAATAADTEYTYPAKVRWCNSLANSLAETPAANSCQAKQSSTFQYVRFSTTSPASVAYGLLTIGDSGSNDSVTITQVKVNGVNIINSTITASGGTNSTTERTAVANALVTAINNHNSTPEYIACAGTGCNSAPYNTYFLGTIAANTVVIIPTTASGSTTPITDDSRAGYAIEVTAPVNNISAASGTVTIGNSGNGTDKITSITVGPAGGPFVEILNGGLSNFGSNSQTNRRAAATAVSNRINTYTNVTPWEYTARVNQSCGGQSNSRERVCIDAPESAGNQPNGYVINVTTQGTSAVVSTTAFRGGVSRSIPTTTQPISAGSGASSTFQRVDIVPGTTTYEKASTRTDCNTTAGVCTYDEEMTNFANWYAYYRSRLQMMKTATGLAFKNVGDKYRVGFVTINHTSGSSSSRYLKINDYTASHKETWYSRLYGTSISGGTPLRGALSRVGRMYAGSSPWVAADDPVQYSCQQNFALLTSDGYWNEDYDNNIKGITGNIIANEDNVLSESPRPIFDGGSTAGTCGANSTYSSCGTLADVAYHFYKNDLRTEALDNCDGTAVDNVSYDVCTNNVPSTNDDPASYQHMTTFTLGLGVDGELDYREDYRSATTGDFAAIKQGTKDWPLVKKNTESATDDLWHAAVNGHGVYFSAKTPNSLASGLAAALAGVSARLGAGAAAATSNLEPVAGDNAAYVASFTTQSWVGNLEARSIDTQTGVVGHQANWCAEDVAADTNLGTTACDGTLKTLVDAHDSSERKILFNNAGTLADFTWDNLSTELRSHFEKTSYLTQSGTWPAATASAASGEKLVSFLRGEYGYEDRDGNTYRLFRTRERTLGDIVGSQPIYVKAPYFFFEDPGYQEFKAAQADRTGVVLIGSNDGMLHAFNAETGAEEWAFIPTSVMRNMWRLADSEYKNNHRYFVDGPITISDICTAACDDAATATWKTILVGALKAGGRGYYALDITDTTSPSLLWEFTSTDDSTVGYSFGKPIITKRTKADSSAEWTVILTSGLNNIPKLRPAPDAYADENVGDGKGYLYVLNPSTGEVLNKIATDVGTVASPSGLSKVSAWSDEPGINNLSTYIYGGDLLGNLWRFNLQANTVQKIATLKDEDDNPQPVTTEPELAQMTVSAVKKRFIMVATGKLIFENDRSDAQQQTIYGMLDEYTDSSSTISDPRSVLVQQTLTESTLANGSKIRSVSSNEVDYATKKGWYIDLPDNRERVNVDPKLVGGTLVVPSNAPVEGVCTSGGYSWLNFFDYKTGGPAIGSQDGLASIHGGNALIVGMAIMKLPTGFVINVTLSDSPTPIKMHGTPIGATTEGTTPRRVSWRELLQP